MVIGEVVPKNLAIEKADRLALLMAPALLVFLRISAPFVFVIERAASALSAAIGLHGGHGGGGHSPEELKFIVESSRLEGHLEGFEEDAIQKLLELKEVNAREIMTPRMEIVSVSGRCQRSTSCCASPWSTNTRACRCIEGKPEHIIGIVHYKDLIRAWQERKFAADRRMPARPFLPAPLSARSFSWCRKPSRSINWSTNFARNTRIWRWWSMSSEPSPDW